MSDRFDYESAREHLWDSGLDPDDLPEKDPQRRDAYLRKNRIDPDQFKHQGRGNRNGPSGNFNGFGGSGTGGCFLTTACVQAKNLSDDCDELETLRVFRDSFMMSTEQGRTEVEYYYGIAPAIVNAINSLPSADEIWNSLFNHVITPAVSLIKCGRLDEAYQLYKNCIFQLQSRFILVH